MTENDNWRFCIAEFHVKEYELTWKNLWLFFKRLIGVSKFPMTIAARPTTISFWYRKCDGEIITDEVVGKSAIEKELI